MRHNLGIQVLVAVIAGILVGLFLGPFANVFHPIASIYVMILQMVVLPYIALSIIQGLGALTPQSAKELFKKGWPFWTLLWGIMFFVIFLLTVPIPKVLSNLLLTEVSATPIKAKLGKNLLEYLIPANPVFDFANNIVPAIAVFGVIIGVALMFIDKKEPLLSLIDRGNQIIDKIFQFLALIAPIAVFAHVAVIMGTIDFSELHKLEYYLISFIAISLFLTFWVLPQILATFTPLSFHEALHAIRTVCLISFVTGVSTIAIPFINNYLRSLNNNERFVLPSAYQDASKTIVPVSYSFAQIGNGLLLFLILFVSFYYRNPLSTGEKCLASLLTIPMSIGSSAPAFNAVSFLFKELNFPDQAVDLFNATNAITMNFQALLSVAGVLTFILLVLFGSVQIFRLKWKKLAFHAFGSLFLMGGIIFAISPMIHLQDNYKNLYLSRKIIDMIEHPVAAIIYRPNEEVPNSEKLPGEGVLERILRTGTLRVGYDTLSNVPYVYHNQDQELVGLDIATAYQLAQDLGCILEFIPIHYDVFADELNSGRYDIAMSAILMTEKRIQQMSFSDAYSEQNLNLVLPVQKKAEFVNLIAVQAKKGLIIGATGGYLRAFYSNFPLATLKEGNWEIELEAGHADAWISSHIISLVWCLNHPDFTVQEYGGRLGKCYFAYPVQLDALTFLRFLNNWIELKRLDGFYQKQYDYWIVGKSPKKIGQKRWSVLRDVLHWVN